MQFVWIEFQPNKFPTGSPPDRACAEVKRDLEELFSRGDKKWFERRQSYCASTSRRQENKSQIGNKWRDLETWCDEINIEHDVPVKNEFETKKKFLFFPYLLNYLLFVSDKNISFRKDELLKSQVWNFIFVHLLYRLLLDLLELNPELE